MFNRKYIFKGSIFQPAMLVYRSVNVEGEAINYFLKILRFITKLFISCRNMFWPLSTRKSPAKHVFRPPFVKRKAPATKIPVAFRVPCVFLQNIQLRHWSKGCDTYIELLKISMFFFQKRNLIIHPSSSILCGKFHHPSSSQSSMIFHNV